MVRQRRWHIFVLSFLFSLLLWFSVNLGGKYQTIVSVKLNLSNLPKGKSLITPLPEYVNIKFSGTGYQLASLYFNPNIRFELNLDNANKKVISLQDNLKNGVNAPSKTEAIDITPDTLFVGFDNYIEKKIPVKANLNINCITNYGVIGEIKTNPDSIIIGGAESIMKKINYWETGKFSFDEIKDDIVTIIPLKDTLKQINFVSHRMIGIEVNVQMLAEQKYESIPIQITDLPPNVQLTIIPPTFDIIVRSGVEYLSSIDQSMITAKFSYKKILHDSLGYIVPEINVPKGLRIIQLLPNKFDYVVRK